MFCTRATPRARLIATISQFANMLVLDSSLDVRGTQLDRLPGRLEVPPIIRDL